MCGVIGFFVGCEFAETCPFTGTQGCAAKFYQSAFERWDKKASVRRSERREVANDKKIFPDEFIPILKHPIISQEYAHQENRIRHQHLQRYLNFTHKLELVVVNDITLKIALGHYGFELPPEMLMDAHRIYVDESYHALFSFDMMQQLAAQVGTDPGILSNPSFLGEILRITNLYPEKKYKLILGLFFVIVSETLITDSLREIHKNPDVDSGVKELIKDHAQDEARHHAFYRHLLFTIWPQIPEDCRRLVVRHLSDLIFAFVNPDRNALISELKDLGVPLHQAIQVFEETYTDSVVFDYANGCSKNLRNYFKSLGLGDDAELTDRFSAANLKVVNS